MRIAPKGSVGNMLKECLPDKLKRTERDADAVLALLDKHFERASLMFDRLIPQLASHKKHLDEKDMCVYTHYGDNSVTAIFRILRPPFLKSLVWSFEWFEGEERVDRAEKILRYIVPFIQQWLELIDKFDAYYHDKALVKKLRNAFTALQGKCKWFATFPEDRGRIKAGRILSDDYASAYNSLVRCYENLPCTTATVCEDKAIRDAIVKAAYDFAAEREEKMKHDPEKPKFKLLEVVRFFYQDTKRWEAEKWIVNGKRLSYEPKSNTKEAVERAMKSLSAAVRRKREAE